MCETRGDDVGLDEDDKISIELIREEVGESLDLSDEIIGNERHSEGTELTESSGTGTVDVD